MHYCGKNWRNRREPFAVRGQIVPISYANGTVRGQIYDVDLFMILTLFRRYTCVIIEHIPIGQNHTSDSEAF